MSKAKELLEFIEAFTFTKSALDTKEHKLAMRKAGMRSTTSGRTTIITSPRSNKRIVITDTGRDLRIKRFDKGKQASKEVKSWGSQEDITAELNWAAEK